MQFSTCSTTALMECSVKSQNRKRSESPTNPTTVTGPELFWHRIGLRFWITVAGFQKTSPRDAFMLGRPDLRQDAKLETVGVYGIGMKRAIFKMGRHCVVTSQPDTGPYKVEITSEWLEEDGNWKLPLTEIAKKFPDDGTRIAVTDLYDGVSRQFDEKKSSFVSDLVKEISRLYALIIEKGFKVYVNSKKEVEPVDLVLLTPNELAKGRGPQIEPYVFVGDFEGVHIDLVVGFRRSLAKEKEIDDEVLVRRVGTLRDGR